MDSTRRGCVYSKAWAVRERGGGGGEMKGERGVVGSGRGQGREEGVKRGGGRRLQEGGGR